jgi:fumarate hydratase class II
MGSVQVPADAYYGAQTRRAQLNFQISPLRLPRGLIRALGLIKQAAAHVNLDLGLLDPTRAQAIIAAATEVADGQLDDQFVVDLFQTGSGTSSNMNVNEVVASRANELLGQARGGKSPVHPNDHVNLGQSSNDVFPTAIHVAAVEAISNSLIPSLRSLHEALQSKAEAFDSIVKIGRTHLQDAVPIRLGQEFAGYAAQIQHGLRRLDVALNALAELPIGGTAIGTGINTHTEFPARMAAQLSRATGLVFKHAEGGHCFESIAARDAAVEASGLIRTVAISLGIIANNIRWLASGPRCGLGELLIPELQPGSSIMPAKVNPVIPEAVLMVTAQIVGNDATIAWANATLSNFQLNVGMPVIAYNLLQSIELLAAAADHLRTRCLDARDFFQAHAIDPPGVTALQPSPQISNTVERSLAMCTVLAPEIGYDAAAAIAKHAYHHGLNVRDVVLSLAGKSAAEAAQALHLNQPLSRDIPDAERLHQLLDPYTQTIRGTGLGRAAGG